MLQAHLPRTINYSYDLIEQCRAPWTGCDNLPGNIDFALRTERSGGGRPEDASFSEALRGAGRVLYPPWRTN